VKESILTTTKASLLAPLSRLYNFLDEIARLIDWKLGKAASILVR